MNRWIEDYSFEAPEGHRWERPAPEDCPRCPCHTARVCRAAAWSRATRPETADGSPYTAPCPCEGAGEPLCCGHPTCRGGRPCGYVLAAMLADSPRCACEGPE